MGTYGSTQIISNRLSLTILPNERWWGGNVSDGRYMPFGAHEFSRDLSSWRHTDSGLDESSNQSAPLLISTRGRYVWSETPFHFTFEAGQLDVDGQKIVCKDTDGTLGDAYRAACAKHFPPSGDTPAQQMFSKPQYNTWIEMPYHPTQEKTLAYAQSMLDAGMPAGVLMIDDKWSPDYGDWTFERSAFPNPEAMLEQLHDMGFDVILWLVPFVSPDSAVFRSLEAQNLLLKDKHGRIAIRRWWNGLSAVLDLSNPETHNWIHQNLDRLCELGVDGFKFDGADLYDFHPDDQPLHPMTPNEMCEQWARIGTRYPFNEFRACWKMGCQPLAQRLQDKPASWGPEGLGSLIPEMLAQSMIGHAFICPDMIGGGEVNNTLRDGIDQEFFVRYAQVAALSPMMQFSVAPSRVLDEQHLAAVREALNVRKQYLDDIIALSKHAADSGEPIIRPLSYHYYDCEDVTDQFMLGPDLIVAPITTQGCDTRTVTLPTGRWHADNGDIIEGPITFETPAPLNRLPRFDRIQ